MAIKLVETKKEYSYVPVSEREEKKPVTFTFKPLNKELKAKLEDKLILMNDDKTIHLANASYILGAVKVALKKVDNLVDADGKAVDIKIEHNQVADSFLEKLPDEIIQELGQVIIAVSKDPANADVFLGISKDK